MPRETHHFFYNAIDITCCMCQYFVLRLIGRKNNQGIEHYILILYIANTSYKAYNVAIR